MKNTKFTVIDAVIVVVVLAVAVFGISMLKPGRAKGEEKIAEFSVLASACDEGIGSIVKVGDEVSISYSEQAFATVTSVEEKPYTETTFNQEKGEYVVHEIKGKSEVKIGLECPVGVTDAKIANGNVPIRVGNSMSVRGKGYTIWGYVVEVEDK